LKNEIYIAPLKFGNLSILKEIENRLKKLLWERINFIQLGLDIESAYSEARAQYFSTQIIADASKLTGEINGKIILITEADLFVPVLTFVFGEAQLNGKHAIVSVCRLHEEFYSGTGNDELLIKRTIKEILHELGHCYGLKHCSNWDCVMHSSAAIEEVDIKGEFYCRHCRKLVVST